MLLPFKKISAIIISFCFTFGPNCGIIDKNEYHEVKSVMDNGLSQIRNSLERNIGRRVKVTARKGRKKSIVTKGVIESTYPSIFIVRLDALPQHADDDRRVAYSYTDILTKSVELALYKEPAV